MPRIPGNGGNFLLACDITCNAWWKPEIEDVTPKRGRKQQEVLVSGTQAQHSTRVTEWGTGKRAVWAGKGLQRAWGGHQSTVELKSSLWLQCGNEEWLMTGRTEGWMNERANEWSTDRESQDGWILSHPWEYFAREFLLWGDYASLGEQSMIQTVRVLLAAWKRSWE